jgi:23S rRNA pseudouridine955/2504/2580 synthase
MLEPLFEDELILAVSKGSGLPSQTLKDSAQETAETILGALRPGLSLHLLHRLDTGTSGVLLFAKSKAAFDEIRLKFKNREIRKFYRARCALRTSREKSAISARLPVLPCTIDLPLAHHPKSKKRMIALPPGRRREYRGKPLPAITLLHGMKPGPEVSAESSLEFEIEIKTGVMHQIRVHLAESGFPILGDPIYGRDLPPYPRLALHAERVEFELRGFRYRIESKNPRFD